MNSASPAVTTGGTAYIAPQPISHPDPSEFVPRRLASGKKAAEPDVAVPATGPSNATTSSDPEAVKRPDPRDRYELLFFGASDSNPRAYLNDREEMRSRMVGIGDKIGDSQVLLIDRGKKVVTLRTFSGEEFTLTVKPLDR